MTFRPTTTTPSNPAVPGAAAPLPALVAPLVPAYDDLPAGSNLRREFADDGLTVSAPAGEVPESARRAAAVAALVWSPIGPALVLTVLAAAGLLLFHDNLRRLDAGLRVLAEVSFAAFALGVFLLAWRADRDARLDALARGRRQSTVLYATRDRLLIETGGPFGAASHDLAPGQIGSIAVQRLRYTDPVGKRLAMTWLVITMKDGPAILILPGREELELRWVAGALGKVMGDHRD